jgi:hypothetical protein
MSKFKDLIEAARQVQKLQEAETFPLPASSQKLLKDHQKAIKKLSDALRDYHKSLFKLIDDEPNRMVPSYDDTINYDSGADKFSPLAQKASDGSFLIQSKIRDINTWEKTTTKAVDSLVRGKYPKNDEDMD